MIPAGVRVEVEAFPVDISGVQISAVFDCKNEERGVEKAPTGVVYAVGAASSEAVGGDVIAMS
jgi:hypothetical protein